MTYKQPPPLCVRLPPELRELLEARLVEERQNFPQAKRNGLIVELLAQGLDPEDTLGLFAD